MNCVARRPRSVSNPFDMMAILTTLGVIILLIIILSVVTYYGVKWFDQF